MVETLGRYLCIGNGRTLKSSEWGANMGEILVAAAPRML